MLLTRSRERQIRITNSGQQRLGAGRSGKIVVHSAVHHELLLQSGLDDKGDVERGVNEEGTEVEDDDTASPGAFTVTTVEWAKQLASRKADTQRRLMTKDLHLETDKETEAYLQADKELTEEIDSYLAQKMEDNLRRKELLYKKWLDKVFFPVQRQLSEEMNSPAYQRLDNQKRELFNKYLEFRDHRGHIFRDNFSPDEYDPTTLSHSPGLKVYTNPADDPLLQQEQERLSRQATISRCEIEDERSKLPGPLVPLGRHGTTCKDWLAMQLTYVDSAVRSRSRQRMRPERNYSEKATHCLMEET